MSREILFRGRREDNGEWVYGSLVMVRDAEFDKEYPCIVVSYDNDSFDWYNVDLKTIGQYTGLTDKNGVKIFEGDIVECVIGLKYAVVFSSYANFGLKPFYSNVKNIEYQSIDNIYAETSLLVIGNIHDK